MYITPKNLPELLKKRKLSVVGFVRELNKLQAALYPEKKPVTRNLYYHSQKGHTPNRENLYLMAAVLKVHPKKMYTVTYDDAQYAKNLEVYSELSS